MPCRARVLRAMPAVFGTFTVFGTGASTFGTGTGTR
jgi:hypothetical protein